MSRFTNDLGPKRLALLLELMTGQCRRAKRSGADINAKTFPKRF